MLRWLKSTFFLVQNSQEYGSVYDETTTVISLCLFFFFGLGRIIPTRSPGMYATEIEYRAYSIGDAENSSENKLCDDTQFRLIEIIIHLRHWLQSILYERTGVVCAPRKRGHVRLKNTSYFVYFFLAVLFTVAQYTK